MATLLGFAAFGWALLVGASRLLVVCARFILREPLAQGDALRAVAFASLTLLPLASLGVVLHESALDRVASSIFMTVGVVGLTAFALSRAILRSSGRRLDFPTAVLLVLGFMSACGVIAVGIAVAGATAAAFLFSLSER